MNDIVIVPYAPEHQTRWDQFVRRSKNGTFLFERNFMDYHSDRFIDASALVMDEANRLLALFPANRSGARLSSHAGLSYGGMISDEAMTSSLALAIFAAWFRHFREQGIAEVVYKAVPPIYHRMPADEDRYALFYHGASLYRRDTTQTVELATHAPVQERRRRGVKKAHKAGLAVRETDSVEAFWEILAENLASRHQLRPVHTADELRLLKGRFPDNIRLFGVYESGALHAGTLLFCCGSTIHAQYIASSMSARMVGALDLLFATLIEMFRSSARYFDFGNSNECEGRYLNRGLIEFKEGFGARAIVQDFYRLDLAAWTEIPNEARR
jgi:Acetyltransferase (GNAT) domain